MSWQVLSPFVTVLGALGLAGVLFLLARLRVRHTEHVVPTTLFWKAAIEETRARELTERFRHPWAYLLTLLLALLIWFAFAGPKSNAVNETERVVLIDTSALDDGRWQALADELERVVDGFDAGSVRVVTSGLVPATVFAEDDEPRLADERFAALPRELAPRRLERDLLALGRGRTDERPLELTVVGPTPVREGVLELLDDDVTVRAVVPEALVAEGNRGIARLGLARAASGRFDTVDVLIEVTGPAGADPDLALDKTPLVPVAVDREDTPSGRTAIVRDVPANGDVLRVTLSGDDGYRADDAAAIRLPRRTRLRVSSSSTDENVALLLASDPGIELVTADAEVHVGAGAPAGVPRLEFVGDTAEPNAFQVVYAAEDEAERVLLESWQRLGLEQVDGTGLAEQLGEPLGFGARKGDVRAVRLRAELLSSAYDFVDSQSFPLFVSGALRWLAGVEPLVDEVRAGDPIASRSSAWSQATTELAVLGGTFTPPTVGEWASADGSSIFSSLLDGEVSASGRAAATTLGEPVALAGTRGALDWIGWLVVLAFLVLGAEWWLVQRGRMP